MKSFKWNPDKNMTLKRERGVSFEEVLVALTQGALLDVLEHSNKERYKNQRVLIVRIRNYVFLVPFVETDKDVFLKTIIPSRTATRKYLAPEDRKNEK